MEVFSEIITRDVTEILDLAFQASNCDQAHAVHKPSSYWTRVQVYVSGELAEWLGDKNMSPEVRPLPSGKYKASPYPRRRLLRARI